MATRFSILFFLPFILQACVQGVIYTHKTVPLTINNQKTSTSPSLQQASGDTRHINVQLQAAWNSNGIGEIAEKNGIQEIYYADLETVSVLFGIWKQEYVHIYGQGK